MKLTIIFNHDFEVSMKKQFGGAFQNPLTIHGVKKIYMKDGYLHSVIWDDRMWRLSDISQFIFEQEDEE